MKNKRKAATRIEPKSKSSFINELKERKSKEYGTTDHSKFMPKGMQGGQFSKNILEEEE